MNETIKKAFERGNLILVLGAGSSMSSLDGIGRELPSGGRLAEELASEFGLSYSTETLGQVYASAKRRNASAVDRFLEARFTGCTPSDEYNILAKYPWTRIYTLNIDDAFDTALRRHSGQRVKIRYRNDQIEDQDQTLIRMDYVKLNGCATRMEDGLIFSEKEYAKGMAEPPQWYQELGRDYYRNVFIFIGTTLNEPLFKHQVERYQLKRGSESAVAYLLIPKMTDIEKDNILDYNIYHLPNTLTDLVEWLEVNYPKGVDLLDVAKKRNPFLSILLQKKTREEQIEYTDLFKEVFLVGAGMRTDFPAIARGQVRKFYKGFKPEWEDIVHDVPARLESTEKFIAILEEWISDNEFKVGALVGQAGSGKNTLLKQAAYCLAQKIDIKIYYIDAPHNYFKGLLYELERGNEPYLLFCSRISDYHNEISDVVTSGKLINGKIIGGESKRVWENRIAHRLEFSRTFEIGLISRDDAKLILEKLEKYGPWTRLSHMSRQDRIKEVFAKSKRQLLIGLLEATMGRGFEDIIEKDYSALTNEEEKKFVVLTGLGTMHRYHLSETIAQRALENFGISGDVYELVKKTTDIISLVDGHLVARHPVYIRYLFENVVEKSLLKEAIISLLRAYVPYGAPVIKKAPKNEAELFKNLINHKFLSQLLNSNFDLVIGVYKSFEKFFEVDGLYWNQYGLALRDFSRQDDAYDKLKIACDAHSHPHTEHALAQQELILALNCDSKERAMRFLQTAIPRLERLSAVIESDEYLPDCHLIRRTY